jgi:nicotinic acid mononucleotide adenylyltransferase
MKTKYVDYIKIMRQQKLYFIMGRDTLAEIITSIQNADMDRKGTV